MVIWSENINLDVSKCVMHYLINLHKQKIIIHLIRDALRRHWIAKGLYLSIIGKFPKQKCRYLNLNHLHKDDSFVPLTKDEKCEPLKKDRSDDTRNEPRRPCLYSRFGHRQFFLDTNTIVVNVTLFFFV